MGAAETATAPSGAARGPQGGFELDLPHARASPIATQVHTHTPHRARTRTRPCPFCNARKQDIPAIAFWKQCLRHTTPHHITPHHTTPHHTTPHHTTPRHAAPQILRKPFGSPCEAVRNHRNPFQIVRNPFRSPRNPFRNPRNYNSGGCPIARAWFRLKHSQDKVEERKTREGTGASLGGAHPKPPGTCNPGRDEA